MLITNHRDISSTNSIAITGAGGFIGLNLTKLMIPLIDNLCCIGPKPLFHEKWMDSLEWIDEDISNNRIINTISRYDTVIHLASSSTPASANKNIPLDAEKNIISSLNFFDHCVSAGVRQIILVSSGGTVYGLPESIPTPESSQTSPINAYGVTKLAIEKYLNIYSKQNSLRGHILRVSNAYGPYQHTHKGQGVIAAFLFKALNNEAIELWGNESIIRDYIFINDVIESIISTIDYSGKEQVFNIGSGIGYSLGEVISVIEEVINRPIKIIRRKQRPVDLPVNILDCSLAQKELGWSAHTELKNGVSQTAEWINYIKYRAT